MTTKNLLLSAALCATLTAPTQASFKPDENTSTNSTSLAAPAAPWDIGISNAAKLANASHPLMSLNRGTLIEVCKILAENGHADAIANLGQSSIHMVGRILRPVGEYHELFPDEFTRINNPDMRQAIRVELRKAINARAEELATRQKASETQTQPQSEDQPKARLLAPWKELLGENAPLQHLIRALQMLNPQNVNRLEQNGLLEQLTAMKDKTKALALGACAAEFFTEDIGGFEQECIIYNALGSSRPLSDYPALRATCRKYLCTEKTSTTEVGIVISAALSSFRSLFEIELFGDFCRTRLCTKDMAECTQIRIISFAMRRPDAQIMRLVTECHTRPGDSAKERCCFILRRFEEMCGASAAALQGSTQS